MTKSLKALLTGIIDYAGLFPPAKLPLDEAIADYASYRGSEDNWMLSHFVIPAGRLAELRKYSDTLLTPEDPFTFSVLAGADDDPVAWREDFAGSLALIDTCLDVQAGRVAIPVLELRLPAALCQSTSGAARMGDYVDAIADSITGSKLVDPVVFLELPTGESAAACRRELARIIAAREKGGLEFGVKLRTGGLEAAAFPTTDEVAAMIRDCREFGCRWKATAGLHHPLRSYRLEVQATMHGFLNLLVATVLTHAGAIPNSELTPLIETTNGAEFDFDDTGLAWRDRRADLAAIEAARRDGFISIGSCSFNEPREDLQTLKLM